MNAWVVVNGISVCGKFLKRYSYRGIEKVRVKVDGRESNYLVSDVKFEKRKKLPKPVFGRIDEATTFDRKCMAEIFHMTQSSQTDFTRGNVLLEVRKVRGRERFILFRMESSREFYEIEVAATYDANVVANRLYEIMEYQALGWNVYFDRLPSEEVA